MFRQKFWGTLLLSIPTVIWRPMIQHWFGYEAPGGPVATRWIPAVFGTLVFGTAAGYSSGEQRTKLGIACPG
jgi:P-type Cu2+ transporter